MEYSDLTYEDIMPGVRNFKTVEISKKEIGHSGRFYRECRSCEFFITPGLGEVEVTEWTKIAVDVIRKMGDGNILDAIVEHVQQYCLPFKGNEIQTYAAECLLHKSYESWIERGEFKI